MDKKIPDGLVVHGYVRTDNALKQIEKAKAEIRRDLKTGKLGKLRKTIDRAYVIRRAGLNQYFLKGSRHSTPPDPSPDKKENVSTKQDVQNFVEEINLALLEREPDLQAVIDGLRDTIREWEGKYERVSNTIHKWAGELRKKRKEVRDLERQLQHIAKNPTVRVLPVASSRPKR